MRAQSHKSANGSDKFGAWSIQLKWLFGSHLFPDFHFSCRMFSQRARPTAVVRIFHNTDANQSPRQSNFMVCYVGTQYLLTLTCTLYSVVNHNP